MTTVFDARTHVTHQRADQDLQEALRAQSFADVPWNNEESGAQLASIISLLALHGRDAQVGLVDIGAGDAYLISRPAAQRIVQAMHVLARRLKEQL